MTTNLGLSDVPEILEAINHERQFLASLERHQSVLAGQVSSDPEARRELSNSRAEIASIRQAIKELEAQLDIALERPIKTTTQS